jgi:putative ABC transport system permease protein
MKKFLKIFIILEILLFAYIFNSSIYNIYEKNNIAADNLSGYVIEETSPETLNQFYSIFTENYPNNKIELINNTLTSTDNSVYDLYCYPLDKFEKKQPVSQTIEFKYHELTKEDFLDSVGIFYTDLSDDEIDQLATQLSTPIIEYEDTSIPYSMILELNLFNFIILFIVILIIYGIYTSYSLKKIGIKKSMGFSTLRILKEQIISVAKYYPIVCLALLAVLNLYYAFTNRFDFSYLIMGIFFFGIVLIVNVLCMLLTSALIKFVRLEAMIKNKTLNKSTNAIVQFIKVAFSVVIAITIISLLQQSGDYMKSQQAVLDYKYLDGYYTSNGFNSAEYNYAISNPDVSERYSNSVLELYRSHHSLLCDYTGSDEAQGPMGASRPYYVQQTIIANENYIKEFSNIQINGTPLDENVFSTPTVLIPEMYKNDESLIKDHLTGEYDLLLNYNQNYGIQEETRANEFNIVYIDDSSTIKVNTEKGFSDITGGIIIVDTGDFGGLYYLDALNNRSLFFSVESREEFSALLTKYDLAQLVVAGTLLTPYLTQLESVTFVLKTLTMFAIVFVVSLVFILYISNYVDVFVNRKRYALKEIMGFSHFKILKSRYIVWAMEIIASVILTAINYYFACFFAIMLLDYLFCELLYRTYIKKALYEIEKGA